MDHLTKNLIDRQVGLYLLQHKLLIKLSPNQAWKKKRLTSNTEVSNKGVWIELEARLVTRKMRKEKWMRCQLLMKYKLSNQIGNQKITGYQDSLQNLSSKNQLLITWDNLSKNLEKRQRTQKCFLQGGVHQKESAIVRTTKIKIDLLTEKGQQVQSKMSSRKNLTLDEI